MKAGKYASASIAYSTDLVAYALTASVTAGSPLPADGDGLVAAINTPKLSNTGQHPTSKSLHAARSIWVLCETQNRLSSGDGTHGCLIVLAQTALDCIDLRPSVCLNSSPE